MPTQYIVPGSPGISIGVGSSIYKPAAGFGVGASTKRRQYAKSPYVDYQQLISVLNEASIIVVPVIVFATTEANLQSRIATLVAAFERFEYVFEYVRYRAGESNVVYSWNAERADWALGEGGVINNAFWNGLTQIVTFSVPRNGPVSGPIL